MHLQPQRNHMKHSPCVFHLSLLYFHINILSLWCWWRNWGSLWESNVYFFIWSHLSVIIRADRFQNTLWTVRYKNFKLCIYFQQHQKDEHDHFYTWCRNVPHDNNDNHNETNNNNRPGFWGLVPCYKNCWSWESNPQPWTTAVSACVPALLNLTYI